MSAGWSLVAEISSLPDMVVVMFVMSGCLHFTAAQVAYWGFAVVSFPKKVWF